MARASTVIFRLDFKIPRLQPLHLRLSTRGGQDRKFPQPLLALRAQACDFTVAASS
jgi:hypothetical protein